ncbi:MAG: hypothetical protein WD691_09630 [Acidimicrobiales bacterium]
MRDRILILAALAILVGGCGGGDGESVTTTSQAPPTTSTSTTALASACDTAAKPSGAASQSKFDADVDGDGRADEVRLLLVGDSDWHLHVTLAAVGTADVALAVLGSEAVSILGGADVDGDGAQEIWARTGAGASATIIGLVRFADCSLTQVTFSNGNPAEFPIGGSVGTASGLECAAGADHPDLTAYTATSSGDDQYDVEATAYALEDSVLTRIGTTTSRVSNRDPAFMRATSFACGSLTF